jgi:hypothetical protein
MQNYNYIFVAIIAVLAIAYLRKSSGSTTAPSLTVSATAPGTSTVQTGIVLTDISTAPLQGVLYSGQLNDYLGTPRTLLIQYKERSQTNYTPVWFFNYNGNLVGYSTSDVASPKDINVGTASYFSGFSFTSIA